MLRYFDGAGGQYRIAFSPLQLATILKGAGPYKFNGSLAAPPNLPAPQTVEMGQPLETTLYQDASSRVYDQIHHDLSHLPRIGFHASERGILNN